MINFKFKIRNIQSKIIRDINPCDRFIYTKDFGSFKIRKNGKLKLMIDDELIRVQYKGSYFEKR